MTAFTGKNVILCIGGVRGFVKNNLKFQRCLWWPVIVKYNVFSVSKPQLQSGLSQAQRDDTPVEVVQMSFGCNLVR